MLGKKVWRRLLAVDADTVVERVEFDEDADVVVASVRPRRRGRLACGRCGRVSARYDRGEGRRRWRTLDLGEVRCYLEADAPRVVCDIHGVVVAAVPWARHGAGHTRSFDDLVAWLAVHSSKTAVCELTRIAWVTVGAIIARVVTDARSQRDPFDGLVKTGIDEISYKRGHRYLTVVVDHATGRLIWAAVGRDKATLAKFFDLLGPERAARVKVVTADAAGWIADVVAERCPTAVLCIDGFHVVQWATDARRETWNAARRGGMRAHARDLKGARYALWKNPEDLTERQAAKLAWVAQVNTGLYRAYLLKEQLRAVIATKNADAIVMLEKWCAWAARSRLAAFVDLARRVRRNLPAILAGLLNNISNAVVESTNTKLRVLTRMAFGFRQPQHLIAVALLDRGGYTPPLPGRIPA